LIGTEAESGKRVAFIPERMSEDVEVLYPGRFIQLRRVDGWEFASRANAKGVVGVLAVTAEREIVLVEQFRPPLGRFVVELPAGLAGDEPLKEDEPLLSAAQRELLEETGYQARKWFSLGDGPSSAGLTDEMITFFLRGGSLEGPRIGLLRYWAGENPSSLRSHPRDPLNSWPVARKRAPLSTSRSAPPFTWRNAIR